MLEYLTYKLENWTRTSKSASTCKITFHRMWIFGGNIRKYTHCTSRIWIRNGYIFGKIQRQIGLGKSFSFLFLKRYAKWIWTRYLKSIDHMCRCRKRIGIWLESWLYPTIRLPTLSTIAAGYTVQSMCTTASSVDQLFDKFYFQLHH